jgi:hypothetical protein
MATLAPGEPAHKQFAASYLELKALEVTLIRICQQM